jgi:hypothetical protein
MWIIDVQLPLDGSSEIPTGMKSILLQHGVTYKLGRATDCQISLNLKKVSRYQTELKVDEKTDNLIVTNVGHATWIYGNSKEFKGNNPNPLILKKDASLKLRSSNWKFDVFKVPDLKVSARLKALLDNSFPLDADKSLKDDYVLINNESKRVLFPTLWINKLKTNEWETRGRLAKYFIPETEEIPIDVNENDDIKRNKSLKEDNSAVRTKNGIIYDNMIDIKPISPTSQFSLDNQPVKRSRKSQLERIFDEMDDLDDLESYTSQSTQQMETVDEKRPQELKEAENQPTPSLSTPVEEMNDNLSNLSLKRAASLQTIEEQNQVKKLKSESKNAGHNDSFDGLADIFKKTKQLKMDKLAKQEKIVQSVERKPNSNVRIKKFQVKIQNNSNPQVYSNYKMSYGVDPKWENRLNYSKFKKVSNGNNYNPVMDSTIKTIKFKNSNYKSNELQVNLNQNDDMIPELDNIFSNDRSGYVNENSNGMPLTTSIPRKRRREATLFVESDYEGTQENDTNDPFHETAEFGSDTNKKVPSEINVYNTNTINSRKNREIQSRFSNQHSFNNDNDDDDDGDTPVFKSRRR